MEKRVVLVGGGNANLQVLRRWMRSPLARTELVVVTDTLEVPYSGMVPGFVGGAYGRDELMVDLVRLCGRAGASLVEGKALALDLDRRQVVMEGGRRVGYDLLALNVGSVPDVPPGSGPAVSLAAKPLSRLLGELETLDALVGQSSRFHLAVVGSGAGGAELALALKRRYRKHSGFSLTLIDANARPLPGYPRRVSRTFERAFHQAGVRVRLGKRVIKPLSVGLELEGGETIGCDGVLWVTRGAPTAFVQSLALPKDERGFLKVSRELRCEGREEIFATGDAVCLQGHPTLPKAGVFAVRQGPVLWRNLRAAVEGRRPGRYRPQPFFLTLLNTSDGRAVCSYGRFSAWGRWAWKWKDRIDRRWMKKFQDLSRMKMDLSAMRCGGCGAKIPALHLKEALDRIEPRTESHVELGVQAREDAAVFTVGGRHRVVESVDFFRAFPGDLFRTGQVAALNALSDLWAMGAEARTAQAIVVLPEGSSSWQRTALGELLEGIQAGLQGSGAVLVGGHTSEGSQLAVGLAVTGVGAERLFRKSSLKVGDRLVLTQALGTGALLAGFGRGELTARWWESLWAGLLLSNREAARCFQEFGVEAATDVTGFGLGGHLLEMLRASDVSARVSVAPLPVLPGFYKMLEQGIRSTLHDENRKYVLAELGGHPAAEVLFDPQTSGGLLAGVAAERAEALVEALRTNGYGDAAIIGEVVAKTDPRIDVME